MSRPAVFFDRDGVLNRDKGYTYRSEDIEWVDGAAKTIGYFNRKGFVVVVVTNQSGIARGYYTEQDVITLHNWMNVELKKRGAHIDSFYYCPHHPSGTVADLSRRCECRKPEPGMIKRAIAEWNIDPSRSFLVGDKESDILAAQAAGITGYLFTGDNIYQFLADIKKIV
jgi:D-glycero-D-manno-heptose 1,7-bisphosphate phosphatase